MCEFGYGPKATPPDNKRVKFQLETPEPQKTQFSKVHLDRSSEYEQRGWLRSVGNNIAKLSLSKNLGFAFSQT